MSLIRKHVAVLQAWACLALVFTSDTVKRLFGDVVLTSALRTSSKYRRNNRYQR